MKLPIFQFVLFILLGISSEQPFSAESQVFKCQTSQGKYTYQSQPCTESQQQQVLELDIEPKGHRFASPQSVEKNSKILPGEDDRKSPYYHQFKNLKDNIRNYQVRCENAKADIPKIVSRIKKQCEREKSTFCREAEAESLAGNVSRYTWRAWNPYKEIKSAFERKNNYCSSLQEYQDKLKALRDSIYRAK